MARAGIARLWREFSVLSGGLFSLSHEDFYNTVARGMGRGIPIGR